MREKWRSVVGFEGRYEVSNLGRVRSFVRARGGRLMHPTPRGKMGYLGVTLSKPDSSETVGICHHLVLEAFVGPRPPGMWGLHADGKVANCALTNLRWGTPTENANDRSVHGRTVRGEDLRHLTILTEDSVREIRLRRSAGESCAALAHAFGCTRSNIYQIVKRFTWAHVV